MEIINVEVRLDILNLWSFNIFLGFCNILKDHNNNIRRRVRGDFTIQRTEEGNVT